MILLARMTLRAKLLLIITLASLALVMSVALGSSIMRERMLGDRVRELQSVVDTAIGLLNSLQDQVAAGQLDQRQALQQFRQAVHTIRFDGGEGYIVAQRSDGMVIAHGLEPARENKLGTVRALDGRLLAEVFRDLLQHAGSATYIAVVAKPGETRLLPKLNYVARFQPWDMELQAGAYVDDINAAFRATVWKMASLSGVILLLTMSVCWLVSRDIGGSLARLTGDMQKVAAGELTATIAGTDRRDEIGAMAAALAVFRDNAIQMQRLQAGQESLRQKLAEEKRTGMERLVQQFEASVGSVVDSVATAANGMHGTARSLTAAAEQASSQATAVAAASEQASANVQAVASAAEQLSGSVGEISRQVANSSAIATSAVAEAERTNALVQSLTNAAQQVGTVTETISEIANKTNLLALNATIEAARAGDAGKGFAVVAAEVKGLATQTAKATQEISSQIAAIQGVTGETVRAIGSIGATIGQLSAIAAGIASAVEEQSAATQEITRNVQQAAAGTSEVSASIAGVSEGVRTIGGAAGKVLEAAQGLAGQSQMLRGEATQFLTAVKAA